MQRLHTNRASTDQAPKYKPPTDKRDHNGRTTKVLDAEKVPLITEEQLTKLRFDFQREKYFKTGEGQKKKRSDFRDQLQSGIVCAKFSSFIGMDEEVRCMGALDDLLPSETGSIWKTVSDVVLTQEFGKHAQRQGNTFSDEHTVEDRVNPNYNRHGPPYLKSNCLASDEHFQGCSIDPGDAEGSRPSFVFHLSTSALTWRRAADAL